MTDLNICFWGSMIMSEITGGLEADIFYWLSVALAISIFVLMLARRHSK